MIISRLIRQITDQIIKDRQLFLSQKPLNSHENSKIEITLKDQKFEGLSGITTPKSILDQTKEKGKLACKVIPNSNKLSEISALDDLNMQDPSLIYDLTRPFEFSCQISFLSFDDPIGKKVFWHSSAHVLGAALEQYTKGLLTRGPAHSNGFFYDIQSFNLSNPDLQSLESLCISLIKQDLPFNRFTVSKEEALSLFSYNRFKLHFIEKLIPEDSSVVVYSLGSFVDLCSGPHITSTSQIKSFKLTETSSVLWQGDSSGTQLQRVSGISFPSKEQLDSWLSEEKSKAARDHRKLGKNLYFWSPFAAGSAFFLPDGAKIYNKLISMIREEYKYRGFTEVISPNLYNLSLFKQSGHFYKYREDMFLLQSQDEELALKPMNCPGHCVIFSHSQHSYKDLPIRYAEFGVLHRNEISGALSGLTRVRRFVQDDSHIFCTLSQIESEVSSCINFLRHFYSLFNFDFSVELSTRPANSLGSDELWTAAESQLRRSLERSSLFFVERPGEGAFYGPKIDFKLKDAFGRSHQCGTVQLDFNLPKRFNLQYRSDSQRPPEERVIYEDMEEAHVRQGFERPVIIHRAVLGSLERIIAVLTEHYSGKWPFWISPRQVCIVTVSEKHVVFAEKVKNRLVFEGFSVTSAFENATLNKKIREAQLNNFNYIAVIGDKEVETETVSLRDRDSNINLGTFNMNETIQLFKSLMPAKSQAQKDFEEKMLKDF
jgi:threonyl-tRNA synthetase